MNARLIRMNHSIKWSLRPSLPAPTLLVQLNNYYHIFTASAFTITCTNAPLSLSLQLTHTCLSLLFESQEVLWNFLLSNFGLIFCSFKDLIVLSCILIDFQYRCHISASIAIIRCRPHCHQFFGEDLPISLHDQLMGSADERDIVCSIELLHTTLSEKISCSSWGNRPPLNFIGVRPHQITHRTAVRYLLSSVQCPNVIQMVCCWRESAVNTENLIVNDSRQGQKIEDFCAILPNIQTAIFPQAFVIEAVDLSDLTRLMVASQQSDASFITYFQSQQKDEGFY